MLINLSNHPSNQWSEAQRSAAIALSGEIVDLPFPNVDCNATEEEVATLADVYFEKIKELSAPKDCVVHVMGEMTFVYAIVSSLRKQGYVCVASTTERVVEMLLDGSKHAMFNFVKFRRYA